MLHSDHNRALLKKSRRAQQACETCRSRKQRCDGRNPCNTCKDLGGNCIYAAVQPPKNYTQLELMTSQLQQVYKEGRNAGMMLQQVLEQGHNIETRIRDLEAMNRSHHQTPESRVFASSGRTAGPALSTLAYRVYGNQSPLIGFVLVLESLEKHFEGDLADHRTSNYPRPTKKDWLNLTYNEDRLYLHEPSCVVHEPQDISRIRNDLQIMSRETFATLYEMPGYSALRTRQVEEIVKLSRIHIDMLQQWLRCLPPTMSWKDENVPSLDFHVGRICSDYSKQRSMSLLPYLYIASEFKILPQTVEMADLGASQRELIGIASQCVHSAFQCAELSARIYAPRGVTCKACQNSIDYAIHERFETILILVAVYQSELTRFLPDTREKLFTLLARTLAEASASTSNVALQMDAQILRAIQTSFGLFLE